MFFLLDLLYFVGSICGIAAAGYLVADRVYLSRPILHLNPGDFSVQLRIRNVLDEAIIVEDLQVTPPVMAEAASKDGVPVLVVKPYAEGAIQVLLLKELESLKEEDEVQVRASWHTTRKSWPFRRRLSVKFRVADIMAVLKSSKTY